MPHSTTPKLLCIVGPTATGKTNLALALHEKIPGALISADSRQVYTGMDIVTGKDHPQDVSISGVDIVNPGEDCSVAVWLRAVLPTIKKSCSEGELPIIVGGTGLYLRALEGSIKTIEIPPNEKLRGELDRLTLNELQNCLVGLDDRKFAFMNQSDQNNPRRLVRAIEVATYQHEHPELISKNTDLPTFDLLYVGLKLPSLSNYQERIKDRVIKRLKSGIIETQNLLKTYPPDLPSMTALGYRHITRFLSGKLTHERLIEDWVSDELSYVKRQLTWFNAQDVMWFDASSPVLSSEIAKFALSWYHETNYETTKN